MNIFIPQSLQTQIELEEIADVKRQIISPSSSRTSIGLAQDGLLGAYNLTSPTMRINWRNCMNIISYTSFEKLSTFTKDKNYTGHELFTMIIPPGINIKDGNLEIKDSVLTSGRLTKDALGEKKNFAIHQIIWDGYGSDETKKFIDNAQRLINNFNLYNGFTVGYGDACIDDSIKKDIDKLFATKEQKVNNMIAEIENNPNLMEKEVFEFKLVQEIQNTLSEVGKLIMKTMSPENNFNIMVSSGSKGSVANIAQISGCMGFQAVEGTLPPKKYNDRSLPYFHQNDDRIKARGLIREPFFDGLDFSSFCFLLMAGREGIIDGAIKTATTGYAQRRLVKSMEDIMVKYDSCVRTANNSILQLVYGDGGADTTKQYRYNIKFINYGDKELESKHKFTDKELKEFKNFSEKDNDDLYKEMQKMRDEFRHIMMKAKCDFKALQTSPFLPINLSRIINTNANDKELQESKSEKLEPSYILKAINNLLKNENTLLMMMSEEEQKNDKSVKNHDEKLYKTFFKMALYDALSPKSLIMHFGINKTQFDKIIKDIKMIYNSSIIQPGQMIGVLSAQALGETITQMTLNSVDWDERIIIAKNNKILTPKIGEFIDDVIKKSPKKNIQEYKNSQLYVPMDDNDEWKALSTDEDGNMLWTKLEAVTRHPVINEDGTDTILEVELECGRKVKATKGKSFLTYSNDKITEKNGSELKIGDLVPLAMNLKINLLDEIKVLDLNVIDLNVIDLDPIVSDTSNIQIPIVLDTYFGFLVGAYLAKGSSNETQLIITHNDGTYLNNIKKVMDKWNVKYDVVCDETQIKEHMTSLIIHSTLLAKIFREQFGDVSDVKSIPVWVFQSPDCFVKGLIDGYISGNDETVLKSDGSIRLSSVSESLLIRLGTLLSRYGIFTNISSHTPSHTSKLNKFDSVRRHHILNIHDEHSQIFANMFTLTHKYKQEKLDIIIKGYQRDSEHCEFNEVILDRVRTIREIKPMCEWVYDLTVEKTRNFTLLNNIAVKDTFHSAGLTTMKSMTTGVPRIQEILSVSKNIKTPQIAIRLEKQYKKSKEMAHKIASNLKYTTFGDIRGRIIVYYDPEPDSEGSLMKSDNVTNVYYSQKTTKNSCQNNISGLPWLMRIEIVKEKMLDKEISLLDIKSKFCHWWETRFNDIKNLKKEEKRVVNKITNMAILSNTDNDMQPVVHLRFNVKDADRIKDPFNRETLIEFIEHIIDKFKLKGIDEIKDIPAIMSERMITYDNDDKEIKYEDEYMIYTSGINLNEIRYIVGIDILNSISNDIYDVYKTFGIEIARSRLIRELDDAYQHAGHVVGYTHLSVLADLMTSSGIIMSIDRHGMGKSDMDVLGRASFEKAVEQILTASVFNETDNMRGVSSRVMCGQVIRGGTGYCDVILDTDMIEKSEYTEENKYKQHIDILTDNVAKDIINKDNENIFIPM